MLEKYFMCFFIACHNISSSLTQKSGVNISHKNWNFSGTASENFKTFPDNCQESRWAGKHHVLHDAFRSTATCRDSSLSFFLICQIRIPKFLETLHDFVPLFTGCLTTDMNKVSAFFMEKSPYFIENFDHILFTTDVSFIIKPYLGEKLKGNSENFHMKKKKFILFQNFFSKFFEIFFCFK